MIEHVCVRVHYSYVNREREWEWERLNNVRINSWNLCIILQKESIKETTNRLTHSHTLTLRDKVAKWQNKKLKVIIKNIYIGWLWAADSTIKRQESICSNTFMITEMPKTKTKNKGHITPDIEC